jgi:uncharacterized protein YbbC (DUF1343 family)
MANGVKIIVTDYKNVEPLETGIMMLQVFRDQARAQGKPDVVDQVKWLNLLSGTSKLYDQLKKGRSGREIIASWKEEVERFKEQRAPYLLYK